MNRNIAKYTIAIEIMAEPMRLNILSLIGAAGQLRGKDLLEKLDLTQPTLSHHMNVLQSANLITSRKEGRCVWYSINKTTTTGIADAILSLNEVSISEPVIKKSPKQIKPAVKKTTEKVVTVETPKEIIKDKKDKDKKKKKKDKDKKKKKK